MRVTSSGVGAVPCPLRRRPRRRGAWPLALAVAALSLACERVEPPGARPEGDRRTSTRGEPSARRAAPRVKAPPRPPRPPENPAVRPPGPLAPATALAPPDPGVVASAQPVAALWPEIPAVRGAPATSATPAVEADAGACPPPSALDELGRRAARLIDAARADDVRLAESLFYPAAPFVALKDARDPAGYHAILLARFRAELTPWLAQQTGWSAARVIRVEAGRPRRIAAGERANKLAYCELTGAAVVFDLLGDRVELPIHTLASQGGRWYVTHLRAP